MRLDRRQYAREYEWARRAKAYDQEQWERAARRMAETLLRASDDLEEVRLFYLNLMRGWIRSPEGEMVPVMDIYQRRMAAKALQNLAGMIREMLAGSEAVEEGEEVEIKEIRAHEPEEMEEDSQEGRDEAEERQGE